MLLSPERLIGDIVGDKPLPMELPPLIRRMVKGHAKDRPGTRVEAPLLDTSTHFYLPLHPPRLAMEYLERCGLLFAECTKLRDRIEALQLDIFNLKQAAKAHDADFTTHRPKMREMWEAEEERLKAQKAERVAAQSLIQANVTAIDNAAKKYPPQVTGDTDNAWLNVHRTIDKNRLHAELAVENAGVNDLEFQIKGVRASSERTRARWTSDDMLLKEKQRMLGVGGELALETRLGGALHRYASLMRDLKEYMFSAEWGLEHVFGVWDEAPWEDLDVDSYADERIDVPLDGLGERLIRLSNAAYGFQLMESAFAASVRVDLGPEPSGRLTGKFRLPLPADTDLAFVRRLRVRGPLVRSASIEIRRTTPFVTRGSRKLPDWLTKDAAPADLAPWVPVYAAAIEASAAPALADMSSPIVLGQLCNADGDSESYLTDRTISYTSASGDWVLTISSPDKDDILAHGLWIDVITSRTQVG